MPTSYESLKISMTRPRVAAQDTSGVRQGCLLLERIMCEALDYHEGSVSIRRRLITNFRFADAIVVNAEEEEGADVLVDCLDTTNTR